MVVHPDGVDHRERYQLTLTVAGGRVARGWWGSEEAARRQFTRWVGQYGSMPGARITLVDEDTGTVLTSWPDEP